MTRGDAIPYLTMIFKVSALYGYTVMVWATAQGTLALYGINLLDKDADEESAAAAAFLWQVVGGYWLPRILAGLAILVFSALGLYTFGT